MKTAARAFPAAVALSIFLVVPAFAQSASGAFHVKTDEGTRDVEFNAQGSGSGASGQIKFSAPFTIPNQDGDEDGTGDLELSTTTVSLRIDVDCLRVDGNRAAIGGVVTDSSVSGYVGRRMLLSVEDGGEGNNAAPDRYTWGQYRSTAGSWTASDAELVFDPGVGLTWIATDAERTDDAGISSVQPTSVTCQSFPLSSYALEALGQGSGNIQVRP